MRGSHNHRPVSGRGQRLVKRLGFAAVAAGAYAWGRLSLPPTATAQDPPAAEVAAPSADYTQRIVGTIFGNVHITREEFGEYLIARAGAEKLDLLINKRIIEHECQQYGVTITKQEVDAALAEDCASIKVDQPTFVANVLKQYGKSLYEWKEDVIRPRLLLSKLCRQQIQVTEADLQQMFEANYGEKVKCRVILFSGSVNARDAGQLWERVRNNPDEFNKQARHQENAYLAARGGEIQPVGHYAAEDKDGENIEKLAFTLSDGEVGPLNKLPNNHGYMILKREGLIPPEKDKSLDKEREALTKLVIERKMKKMIPLVFAELEKRAKSSNYLRTEESQQDLKREVSRTLDATSPGGK